MADLHLQKFDPQTVGPGRVWTIIAPRNSGKTVLMREILRKIRKTIDMPIGMTATTSTALDWAQFMPKSCIHARGFNHEVMESVLALRKDQTAAGKMRSVLIAMDDVAFEQKLYKTEGMRELHLNGRHLGFTVVQSLQYAVLMPSVIRSNCDVIISLADTNVSNRKRLHEMFYGCFGDFKSFDRVFTKVTENYGCLVLDRTKKSGKIEDILSWYRASPEVRPFKLGKEVFFELDAIVRMKMKEDEEKKEGAEFQLVPLPRH